MNKDRRKRLHDIAKRLSAIRDEIEEVVTEEEDAHEALPENLSDSEQAENMQEAIELLNEHMDAIDSAAGALEEV